MHQKKDIRIHKDPVSVSCMSYDGNYIGIGGSDGTTKVINLMSSSVYSSVKVHDMVVKACAFTPNTKVLVSGTPELNILLQKNVKNSSNSGGPLPLIPKIR